MFDKSKDRRYEVDDMGKEERRMVVLQFMKDHPLALPPLIIFRNLKLHENITFSDDSVENYLDEFVEEGLAARVEKEALDSGDLTIAGEDYDRAYYIITDQGREYLEDN